MIIRRYNIHKALFLAATAGLGLWAVSCSEEDMTSGELHDGMEVRFSPTVERGNWNTSRSGSSTGTAAGLRELRQAATDSVLYLHSCVLEGIVKTDGGATVSRSTSVATDNIEDFGVYASMRASSDVAVDNLKADYMANVNVTRANGWQPAAEYLWPGKGSLHFNAYSPFRSGADSDEGIVSLPSAGAGCPLSIDFITPARTDDQIDLLRSLPVDASASPCAVEFTHALTAVRFSTGTAMAPCTVKSIALKGISDRGTLSLETGEWSGLTGEAKYILWPDVTLTAASGSKYAAPDSPITSGDSTLLLLPQTLGEEAGLTLTVESGGEESTFEASLSGLTWTAGTTVIYRISASPSASGLILEVIDSDGNPLTTVESPYTGQSVPFTVRSYMSGSSSAGEQTPVEWEASFIGTDGSVLSSAPGWITDYTSTGSGETSCSLVTDVIKPEFEAISEPTENLRRAADINQTSGHTPYNLSSASGDPSTVENTANCYIINAPGTYSIPLVYGNAIKNGSDNTAAYISTQKASRTTLTHFINHLGNEITSPYIYENTGCEPSDAVLVWEGRLCVTRNVRLSDDRRSLLVDIPQDFIRQANAVVAVRDQNKQIMWSWHLWITDYTPSWAEIPNPNVAGLSYYLFTRSLGRIVGGDVTVFPKATVTLRITQTGVPESQTPLTADIRVDQESKSITVADCYSFYQWSRKDPVVSGIEEYYTADHVEHSSSALSTASFSSDYNTQICQSIIYPSIFYTSGSNAPFYLNLWNIDGARSSLDASNPVNVKTIYDPSPVGARVPLGNVFQVLKDSKAVYDASASSITFMAADGTTPMISFPVLGYRGREGNVILSQVSPFWSAEGRNGQGRDLSIAGETVSLELNSITEGFGIHPARE